MTEPQSKEEYEKRYHANTRIEGFFAETTTIAPCPFCAAPDWLRMPILTTQEAMAEGATCKQCGRSARAVFTSEHPGHTQFELVQTGGLPPPPWLPFIRRVEP